MNCESKCQSCFSCESRCNIFCRDCARCRPFMTSNKPFHPSGARQDPSVCIDPSYKIPRDFYVDTRMNEPEYVPTPLYMRKRLKRTKRRRTGYELDKGIAFLAEPQYMTAKNRLFNQVSKGRQMLFFPEEEQEKNLAKYFTMESVRNYIK